MTVLPTLRQLRYLLALSETLHFGKAAEACFVTQSTLSAGIQELEALLGASLLERQQRRAVALTPLGRDLVQRARHILAEAEALVEVARAAGAPLAGLLRLGVIPTIGPYVLPGLLPAARESYPHLKLYLREVQSQRLLEDLRSGKLDCGLLALPWETGELACLPLWQEDVVAVMPAGHPLAGKSEVSDSEMAATDMLLLEDGHCLRDHALQACGLRKPGGNEAFQATSLGTLIQMVASGLGLTLLPRPASLCLLEGVASAVAVREVCTSSPAGRQTGRAPVVRTVALVWRDSHPRARDFELLAALLQAHLPAGALPAEKAGAGGLS